MVAADASVDASAGFAPVSGDAATVTASPDVKMSHVMPVAVADADNSLHNVVTSL